MQRSFYLEIIQTTTNLTLNSKTVEPGKKHVRKYKEIHVTRYWMPLNFFSNKKAREFH